MTESNTIHRLSSREDVDRAAAALVAGEIVSIVLSNGEEREVVAAPMTHRSSPVRYAPLSVFERILAHHGLSWQFKGGAL